MSENETGQKVKARARRKERKPDFPDGPKPSREIGYRAVGRYLKSPPDKVRIMGRNVLGLPAGAALDILKIAPNKSARLLYKVIGSAVANADHNHQISKDELFVERIMVDRASMLNRYHPCAHGRAKPILKRSCNITVQLGRREDPGTRRRRRPVSRAK